MSYYFDEIYKLIKTTRKSLSNISKACGYGASYLSKGLKRGALNKEVIDYLLSIDGMKEYYFEDFKVTSAPKKESLDEKLGCFKPVQSHPTTKLNFGEHYNIFIVGDTEKITKKYQVVDEYPTYYLLDNGEYRITFDKYGETFYKIINEQEAPDDPEKTESCASHPQKMS